jgi:hypothetical protein
LNSNLLTGETGGERRRRIGVGFWETEKVIGIWERLEWKATGEMS